MATTMFQVRLAGEDRQRLQELAARAQRSESEVVRLLLRQADPSVVNSGIPSLMLRLPEVQASERELSAA